MGVRAALIPDIRKPISEAGTQALKGSAVRETPAARNAQIRIGLQGPHGRGSSYLL